MKVKIKKRTQRGNEIMRSLYKVPYIHKSLLGDNKINEKRVWKKSSLIGKKNNLTKFLIYNGHDFFKFIVKKNCFCNKLGEFVATRRRAKHAGKIKRNKGKRKQALLKMKDQRKK